MPVTSCVNILALLNLLENMGLLATRLFIRSCNFFMKSDICFKIKKVSSITLFSLSFMLTLNTKK